MARDLLIAAEGFGEVRSCGILAARVLRDQGSMGDPFDTVRPPMRLPILRPADLSRACEIMRSARPSALLMTSDFDDGCPADKAPEMAEQVRQLQLPFPVAVVLFYREYESMFVAAATSLAGQELTLPAGGMRLAQSVEPLDDPESRRDAKRWVTDNLFINTSYKPTIHQAPLSRSVDLAALRTSGLSSFRRLEAGLAHLAAEVKNSGTGVYPARKTASSALRAGLA